MATQPPSLLPNLASRLQSLIESLQSNPNISVTEAAIGEPATQTEIREARRAAGGYLPPGLEEFYSQVGSFKLEWAYNGPELLAPSASELSWSDLALRGTVDIIPITEIFAGWKGGGWEGILWFPTGDEDEDEDEESWRYTYRHLKPIDMFIPEAYTVLVGPKDKTEGARFSDHVAYHYCGEGLEETRYTFAEYVERMIVCRGYWYWVTSLCASEVERGSLEVQELKTVAPQIFPDMDLDLFVP
ncbi:uncharacterized protein BJX67DRAFT_108357 [Aspergillus lucknowensis]|uniref:Knr4/Smi1-like domain-containing protein n=1 Tax=Aspergillus lucknowensis TaxID=176173 RepID=A0ABR4LRS2_9EURO